MTGLELYQFLLRRVGEENLALETGREAELYDYLTEARDDLLATLVLAGAGFAVQQQVALEQDAGDSQLWAFPAATRDPLRVLEVFQTDSPCDPLIASAMLERDSGDYQWQSIRQLRLRKCLEPDGGITVKYVAHPVAITDATAEAEVGAPTYTHRAIGLGAAVLALSVDEGSDARNAVLLHARELEKLERILGDFDADGGAALRGAILGNYGAEYGSLIY